MDMKEALAKAWADVEAARIPDHLQEAAFNAAIAHYLGAAPEDTSGAPGGPSGRRPNSDSPEPREGPSDAFGVVARETGATPEQVQELVYIDADGEPAVNVAARRLGSSRAQRVRAVAVIIGAVRHFWLNELEVSVDAVRSQCVQLGIYDLNNFSSDLSDAPGFVYSGPRGRKVLRPKSDLARVFVQQVGRVLGDKE